MTRAVIPARDHLLVLSGECDKFWLRMGIIDDPRGPLAERLMRVSDVGCLKKEIVGLEMVWLRKEEGLWRLRKIEHDQHEEEEVEEESEGISV